MCAWLEWTSKWGADEEMCSLELEELELRFEEQASQDFEEVLDEYNSYFASEYKKQRCHLDDEDNNNNTPCGLIAVATPNQTMTGRVNSLLHLAARTVALNFHPELRYCLPDELFLSVQKHMPKEVQIRSLQEHKQWHEVEGDQPATLLKYCQYNEKGLKNGQCMVWRPTGELLKKKHYSFGKKHGNVVEYWPNGSRCTKIPFFQGSISGCSRWWHENGRLAGCQQYVDNAKHGIGQLWTPNGRLHRSFSFRYGRKEGLSRTFDEKGNLVKCRRYRSGRKQMPVVAAAVAVVMAAL